MPAPSRPPRLSPEAGPVGAGLGTRDASVIVRSRRVPQTLSAASSFVTVAKAASSALRSYAPAAGKTRV